MARKKRVAVIGDFEGGKPPAGGQAVKTVNLYEQLCKATDWDIRRIDSSTHHEHPVRLLLQILWCMASTRDVIVLLAINGRKVLFPLFYLAAKCLKTNIYHDVIGGNLAADVASSPKSRKYMNAFRVNWVETEMLRRELQQAGICNAAIVPNFRCFEPLKENELTTEYEEPYKFCTFSIVREEKGIEDAVKAIQSVNERYGRQICTLTIYGSIHQEYEERFRDVLTNAGPAVSYGGVVPPDQTVETLSHYYATLFPTHWVGESNAGTVTESFFAGVPVAATDWRCNGEMIRSGSNGLLYPGSEAQTLEEAVMWMIDQRDRIGQMKRECLRSAEEYRAEKNIRKIIECIDGNDKKKGP